eukprot:6530033-Prymnesium_polylepis.1
MASSPEELIVAALAPARPRSGGTREERRGADVEKKNETRYPFHGIRKSTTGTMGRGALARLLGGH